MIGSKYKLRIRTAARLGLGLLLFAVLVAPTAAEGAAEPVELRGFSVLVDHGGELSLAEVLAQQSAWRPLPQAIPNFGFSRAVYWFMAPVDSLEGDWLLEIGNPHLDHLDVYQVRGDDVSVQRAGDARPFAQRPLPNRQFLFPLEAGEPSLLVVRTRTTSAVQLPARLWPRQAFEAHDEEQLLLQGLYLGLMGAMVLYNLFICVGVRDRRYLPYVWFVGSTAVYQACLHGMGYQFLWPQAVYWNQHAIAFLLASIAASACIFTIVFLDLRRQQRTLATLLGALATAALVMMPLSLALAPDVAAQLTAVLGFNATLGALLAGGWMWARGNGNARYFTIAWSAFCIGSILLALNKFGFLPRNLFTEHAQQIGSAMEALLLSFALADRINRERRARLRAEAEALRNERQALEANARALGTERATRLLLEQRVRERTLALERAMAELKAANASLAEKGYADGLTGLKNRRFFDEQYRTEWRVAYRDEAPLALILLDVDHLGRINEEHGAAAGDACLKAVARVIAETAARPADTVALFGGGTFAILGPRTSLEGALHLAESIRQKVAAMTVEWKGAALRVTVSAGLAALVPGERHHEAVLLSFADDALFQAKQSGRNRVQGFDVTGTASSRGQPAGAA